MSKVEIFLYEISTAGHFLFLQIISINDSLVFSHWFYQFQVKLGKFLWLITNTDDKVRTNM